MDITTSTTTVFHFALTDQDVADILVDPSDFQSALRTARG